jgi:hypothetical protein
VAKTSNIAEPINSQSQSLKELKLPTKTIFLMMLTVNY